ncbi:MAG: ABC transporter substrate-binding protein [Thalassobaculales bacterium]
MPADAVTPKDTLVIADTIDDITSLDPAEIFEFSGGEVANNTYNTLVDVDPRRSGGLIPSLAESWTVRPDGQTYVFKIRPGVPFSTGGTVSAADVVFSLHRAVLLNKTPAFILNQFGFTKDTIKDAIKATGPMEVTIVTNKAYAPTFLLNCLTATIASIVDSKTAMANAKGDDFGYEWLKTNTAGTGPYVLRQYRPSDIIILERVDKSRQGASAAMKRVITRHIKDASAQRLLLEKADIDVARKLSPDDIAAVRGNKALKVEEDLKGRIWYFSLNQKKPELANPKVVEAFKWAVDYESIAKNILKGQVVPHQAFLPRTYLGELKELPYKFDPAKAKALLAEAGFAGGLKTTMDARNDSPTADIAQAIQANLAQAGIQLEIIPGTGAQTLTKYRARAHDIYIGQWGPDYPDPHTNADTFAHNPDNSDERKATGKLAWRNAWDIPQMSKDTEAALVEKDGEKRAAMYRDIQRTHQKTSPFVIMYQVNIQTAMRANVKGFNTGGAVSSTSYWTVTK